MAHQKKRPGLADPARLSPFEKDNGELVVIIETPKGSRNKYAVKHARTKAR